MSRRRGLAFAIATMALYALLGSGALAGPSSGWCPPAVRVALAFAALILLPGHALLALTGALPPGGAWLSSGWALGLGVAWTAALVLLTQAIGQPFTVLAKWASAPAALLWVLAGLRPRRDESAGGPALGGLALAAIALAAIVAAVHVARLGAPLSFYSDSADHVGTIRRMLANGQAFPTDAFFRDAGAAGIDPRKGLWHACVALIAKLAGADPLVAWQALPGLLAPLFVLNAAAFGALLGGAEAAVAAWALLLTYGGSLGAPYLREAVFSTKLADQLALATATALVADVERPGRGPRLAALGLGLGAIATHVFAGLQFAIVVPALAVGLAIRDRALAPNARRLAVTAAPIAAAALPYALWRARTGFAPGNVIHTEPQGLLMLWDGVRIVSPGTLWDWMGQAWMVIPFSVLAWVRSRRTAALYLLTTSAAVFALMFAPPLVALLQPRLGYLMMRFVWILPLSGAIAFAVPALVRGVRDGRGAPPEGWSARALAALGLAGVLLLLRHPLLDAAFALRESRWIAAQEAPESLLRWSDALAWMDRRLPPGTVVLSDPATSYSVPMLTRHYVATLVDQHSSPNDPHALDRILDARDALDPYGSWARTREVIERYGVGAIALNGRFASPPRLNYWAPNAAWFAAARARFDAEPAAFERRLDTGDFVVYVVRREALGELASPVRPRPFVRAAAGPAPAAGLRPKGGPGQSEAEPLVAGFALDRATAATGDTLGAVIDWRVARPLAAGSYRVAVRFDRDPPGSPPPAWIAKPARKLLERLNHERYRFRDDHLPVNGEYGVDLWRPGEVVADSFRVVVPGDVAAGEYRVQARMLHQPHYPNYRLSDYFFDTDYYSGAVVGRLVVRRPPLRRH